MRYFNAFFCLLGVLQSSDKSEGLMTMILPKQSDSILHAIRVKEEDSPVVITSVVVRMT